MGITWQLQHATGYTFPKEETVYRGWVTDTPETKEHTFLCRVLLKEQRDSTAIHSIDDCKAILYLQRDSAAAGLKRGDELWVSARISPPVNGQNFDEFDYARYLMRKGISGTGYVVSGKWMLASSEMLSSGNGNIARKSTLLEVAGSCRDRILSLYRQLGFEGDGLAVLSALTVGDKTELSDSVRESYSVAGASHVLALFYIESCCEERERRQMFAGCISSYPSLGFRFFYRTFTIGSPFGLYVFDLGSGGYF